MELVKARAETVKPGDRISTPRGVLLRVDEVTVEDGLVRILHERGYFAPVEVGERVIVQRSTAAPAAVTGRETREASGPPADGAIGDTAPASAARNPAGSVSPVSEGRARALAGVLAGFRWAEPPRPGSRRARAAEQVARHALEELAVVE